MPTISFSYSLVVPSPSCSSSESNLANDPSQTLPQPLDEPTLPSSMAAPAVYTGLVVVMSMHVTVLEHKAGSSSQSGRVGEVACWRVSNASSFLSSQRIRAVQRVLLLRLVAKRKVVVASSRRLVRVRAARSKGEVVVRRRGDDGGKVVATRFRRRRGVGRHPGVKIFLLR